MVTLAQMLDADGVREYARAAMNEALAYFTRTVTGEKEAAMPAHLVSVSKRETAPNWGTRAPPTAGHVGYGKRARSCSCPLRAWGVGFSHRTPCPWVLVV